MRLEVDTASYASALDLCYAGNHDVAEAVSVLSGVLSGCGAMAGNDSGGREWAQSYDSVSGDMVRAGADLGGALGAMGNLLNASLVNHEGADYGARIYGPPASGTISTGDDDPEHGVQHVVPPSPPSASGGQGEAPDGWQWLVEHLEGMVWPDADTAKMRGAGDAWRRAAVTFDLQSSSVQTAGLELRSQTSPEVVTATGACTELSGHCTDLRAAYDDVGRACQDYATQVEEHHEEIISTCKELLAWTAADQITGAILSFFTAGAAEVAAQLVEAGIMARYAERVITILRRLVELARVAARTIGRGLARIAEILARLKKFLSAKVVAAIEKVGGKALEKELQAVRKLLADSEAAGGHTLARHVGLSDAELEARLAEGTKTASTFTDQAAAERAVHEVMSKEQSTIDAWLQGTGKKLQVDGTTSGTIGRSISQGDAAAAEVSNLRVVLIRDPSLASGYKILTAFPKP